MRVAASPASSTPAVINTPPVTPTAPTVGTITQPACGETTGSVPLSGLPASGAWILTRSPGGTTFGSGPNFTVTGLATGTYTWTVTNADGCTSVVSAEAVINTPPVTPTAPTVGTITQPACGETTGSVPLSGLPASGTWTLTRTPGGTTTTGTGTSTTISGLTPGSYTWTVTNAAGCISGILHTCCDQHPAGHPNGTHGGNHHPARLRRDHGQCATERTSGIGSLDPYEKSGRDHLWLRPNFTVTGLATGSYTWTVTNCGWLHLGCLGRGRDQHPAGHPNGTNGGDHHPSRLWRDHGKCAARRTSMPPEPGPLQEIRAGPPPPAPGQAPPSAD